VTQRVNLQFGLCLWTDDYKAGKAFQSSPQ
jgi:hypothetical protein